MLEKPEIWGLESISDDAMVIRLVIKTRANAKDDVARELRMRLKRATDAMDVKLPNLSSVVLTGFDGATRVKGAKPPRTAPSAIVEGAPPAKTRLNRAPQAPRSPKSPKPPTGDPL